MSDRSAFRALVTVAGLFLFCLGCLLTLPFRAVWSATSIWLLCCSILMSHMAMPMPASAWIELFVAILAGVLLNMMLVNGLLTAWKLWRATQQLIQATQIARVPQPPIVARVADRIDLTGSLVTVAGQAPFSFCYGLWQPRICLSRELIELLTEAELEAVLQHEAYHLQRREPLRMAITLCLSRFFFFIPLLAELRDRYLAEKELAADAAAVALTSRAALAGALHKLIAVKSPFVLSPLVVVAGLSITAQRVDRLITPSPKLTWAPSYWSMLSTLFIFVLGCLLMITGLG